MKPFKFNKTLFWSLLGLGGVLILFASVSYFLNRASEAGIMFTASTDSANQTIGLPFDIHVVANNDSDNLLKKATLSLLLPNGAIFASGDERKINSIEIGEMRPGEIVSKTFSVIILPSESADREFTSTLHYGLGTVTANFEKKATVQVKADDFPLSLDIAAPETVSPGQDFEVKAIYKNISAKILPAFKIIPDYPDALRITSVVPKANENGEWSVDGLSAGRDGEITIKGNAEQGDSELKIGFKAVLSLGGSSYDVIEESVSMKVEPSPLSIEIKLEGETQAHFPGDTLHYLLSFRNNSENTYSDAVIRVKLTGEMYDLGSLSVKDATFSSVTRTITWTSKKVGELGSISPNAGGNLEFSIDLKDSYSIKRINDRNFAVKAEARIESSTSSGLVAGLGSIESKVAGALLIEAAGYFRDADSLILNSGPLPLVIGTPTNFTIHWRIGSYSTDVSNLEVRARMGEGVTFTGKTKSTNGVLPEIDKETGDVVWKVGKLLATSGILSAKPEAIFQVKAVPTSKMYGEYMELLKETSIKATDDFSGLEISATAEPVTSRLESDKSVREDEGRVIR